MGDHPLCEHAAAYALGALDAGERDAFEHHLQCGCEVCRREVAELADVALVLNDGIEPLAPPPYLRECVLAVAAPTSDPTWEPGPVTGTFVKTIVSDEATRELVMLVRAAPGIDYPAHRHAGTEELVVLEGTLEIAGTIVRPGDLVYSEPESVHGVAATAEGCTFLLRTSLDDEPLP